MIPKVIHYCWFGRGKKPALAEKCIASWRKFLPDYEIREWNEDNWDVNAIPYTAEAYAAKKYAFVSDYARFNILYRHGGVYFDTDVEVIKPMDDILAAGPFMGVERYFTVASGLGLAANSGLGFYQKVLDAYATRHFATEGGRCDLKTVVDFVTEMMVKEGLRPASGIVECAGIKIYPPDYFNPKRPNGKVVLTENTRTIHHYAASWYSPKQRVVSWTVSRVGKIPGQVLSLLLHNPIYICKRLARFAKAHV